jgi:hypothetical protein
MSDVELMEFLYARLLEDEDIARAAMTDPWRDDGGCVSSAHYQITDYGAYTQANGEPEAWEERQQRADSAHIARHDPARVLREVAAKRKLVDRFRRATALRSHTGGEDVAEKYYPVLGSSLEVLAAVYSDHPDYRAHWLQE